jgi:hypothetical protein
VDYIEESPYGPVLLQKWCFAAPNEQKPHHHFQKIVKNQNENINNKSKWKNTKKDGPSRPTERPPWLWVWPHAAVVVDLN